MGILKAFCGLALMGACFSKDLQYGLEKMQQVNKVNGLTSHIILVAEDEPDNYRLLNKLLEKTGASVLWAHNGQEALEFFSKAILNHNTLVLMDLKMPVMNGFDACRAIKEIDNDIKIIAVTAFAQVGDEDHILKSGFDGYLSKPLSAEKLRSTIAEFIH